MDPDAQLARYLHFVAEQYMDREEDWPAIEEALRAAPNINFSKAIALLIGLRAIERFKDSPIRQPLIEEGKALLRWQKGWQAKANTRKRIAKLALRSHDRAQTLLYYGFMLDRGDEVVSRPTVRALTAALVCVLHVPPRAAAGPDELLYQRLRQRVRRLPKTTGCRAEDALALFNAVYATVIE